MTVSGFFPGANDRGLGRAAGINMDEATTLAQPLTSSLVKFLSLSLPPVLTGKVGTSAVGPDRAVVRCM